MSFEDFSGYILAGGKSSRMGTDKAFLKIGEKNFLENAFEILNPICDYRIKIVLNPKRKQLTKKLPKDIPYIFDIFKNRGVLGGIHSALTDCKTKFAIILAVDLPFVTSEAIRHLSQITIGSEQISAVIPKQNEGRLQPLVAVYKVSHCLPIIEQTFSLKNHFSVHDFISKLETKIVDQNVLSKDKNLFLNINDHSDLRANDLGL